MDFTCDITEELEREKRLNKFHKENPILVDRLKRYGFQITIEGKTQPKGFIQGNNDEKN